jgi:hypothetical protein
MNPEDVQRSVAIIELKNNSLSTSEVVRRVPPGGQLRPSS